MMEAEENRVQEYESEPDVDELKSDFERCRISLSYWKDKAEEARDVRRNEWAGKGRYGRKEGPGAFPWEGASDLEPNLVNPLIDGDVALLKSGLTKGNLIAAPVESGDITTAKLVTEFMQWRMGTMTEMSREAGVAANLLLETGVAFLGIYWKREVTRVYESISMEEIAAQAPEVAQAILDPEMSEGVVEMVASAFPNLSKGRAKKMVKELRDTGATEIPTEKLIENRPAVRAYELGRDLIVDSNVLDLQSARAIYCVHWHTPEALKEKVILEGWDSDFVDDAIEVTTGEFDGQSTFSEYQFTGQAALPQNYDGLVKLITCYRKDIDEDGVPICSETVFSEGVEGYATHGASMYAPGKYPFVAITREHLSRRLLDSRGYPELLRSYQLAVKTEMDARRDRASLSTVPPVEYLVGRRPEKLGPGTQVPVRRRGEVGFMEIPRYSTASTEVEMQLRSLANRVTGRATSELDAVEANVMRQALVNNWLSGWKDVLRMVWSLQRQYGGPEIWFRVTGNEKGAQIVMDDTAELYDFNITWDTMNADSEKVLKKLETVGQVLAQYDRSGQARYDEYLRIFLEAVDPNLASKLIAPAQEATNKEMAETSADIAKIYSGQVVTAPQNANSQLRLQIMQQYLQGTQEIPGTDVQTRLQEDEQFAARLQNYAQQLEFQQQQQRNALTGALGAPPGNVPATSMPSGAQAAPMGG